ncbi:hypothetical protein LINPERHAP2_LOCUS23904 [Linum perenne]
MRLKTLWGFCLLMVSVLAKKSTLKSHLSSSAQTLQIASGRILLLSWGLLL